MVEIIKKDIAGLMYDQGRLANAQTEQKLVTDIAFVTLAESGAIDEVTATEHTEVFAPWADKTKYREGNLRTFGEKLYKCVQNHTSQADYTPDITPALWVLAGDPADEWPEWSQPVGAHDAYGYAAKCSHHDKHWVSDYDGNVWEPGVYGWTEES